MPTFVYRATDSSGAAVSGSVEAPTRRDALRQLAARRLQPLEVREPGAPASPSPAKARPAALAPNTTAAPTAQDRVRAARTTSFSRAQQLPLLSALSELVAAGITVGDALRLLANRLQDPKLRQLSHRLWSRVSEGLSVAQAMEELPAVFEESAVHLVEAGEATGNLKDILPRLTSHLQNKRELRVRLALAMAYPVFLIGVASLVLLLFLYFLLPRMMVLFQSLRGELPLSTRLLVAFSEFLLHWGPFFVGGLVLAAVAFFQWRRTPAGRLRSDRWLLGLPVLGQFLLLRDVQALFQTLCALLENGVTTIEALRLSENGIANRHLRSGVSEARLRIAEGASISGAFSATGLFPPLLLDALSIGEQTGSVIPALRNAASTLSQQLGRLVSGAISVISTGALLLVFGAIGFLVFAILSAVFQLSASLKF